MTEAMPFLQKYDITFLRPPTILERGFVDRVKEKMKKGKEAPESGKKTS